MSEAASAWKNSSGWKRRRRTFGRGWESRPREVLPDRRPPLMDLPLPSNPPKAEHVRRSGETDFLGSKGEMAKQKGQASAAPKVPSTVGVA